MRLLLLHLLLLLVHQGVGYFPTRTSGSCVGSPRTNVALNLFENLKAQAASLTGSQPVVRISHVMLRTDEAALNVRTKGECYEMLTAWKERIDDDAEKFIICAEERSECASRNKGGDLGQKTRAQLTGPFEEIAFNEEPGRCYGPVVTDAGLHLVYLHSRSD